MGYTTEYRLYWKEDKPNEEDVTARLAKLMNTTTTEAEDTAFHGLSSRWYESDEHMLQISREWPDTLFILDCRGEDNALWVSFFQNGKHYEEDYRHPEFDPAMLP